jgi:UDP-N-acetylmuramyl pentapeptide phosphotransferase/UDP-N-acetylglucosamine-1-phosphate transferase
MEKSIPQWLTEWLEDWGLLTLNGAALALIAVAIMSIWLGWWSTYNTINMLFGIAGLVLGLVIMAVIAVAAFNVLRFATRALLIGARILLARNNWDNPR